MSASVLPEGWEMVIGLETHVELATATKLFCGCRNRFGDAPNTNVCPVCLGLPGSLPVLNRRAVDFAMRIGRALHCRVEPSVFHRKNYFYPDMPKDYQVSQYDEPINLDGWVELPTAARTRVGIVRAHMEEDTGKTSHVGESGRIHGAQEALVDYNRAGVPLVEIVTGPDIVSAADAKTYVEELRAILLATGTSDARMEEGSMRVDANVSVRRVGEALGTRCEIKNLNSLRSLARAIEYEARRQVDAIQAGEAVVQQTRHWNDSDGLTVAMRSKEEAEDYRYFAEPDLVPLDPGAEWIAAVDASLGDLPADRRARLAAAAGVEEVDAALVVALDLDALVGAAVAAGAEPRLALNRAANEVAAMIDLAPSLGADRFVELLNMESSGALTATQAKTVLAEMLESGGRAADIASAKGFEAMESGAAETLVDSLLAEFPAEAARLAGGEAKVMGFFVGKAMAASGGKADGKVITALLRSRLSL